MVVPLLPVHPAIGLQNLLASAILCCMNVLPPAAVLPACFIVAIITASS